MKLAPLVLAMLLFFAMSTSALALQPADPSIASPVKPVLKNDGVHSTGWTEIPNTEPRMRFRINRFWRDGDTTTQPPPGWCVKSRTDASDVVNWRNVFLIEVVEYEIYDTVKNKWVHHAIITFYIEMMPCPVENQPSGPDDGGGKKKGGNKGEAKRNKR